VTVNRDSTAEDVMASESTASQAEVEHDEEARSKDLPRDRRPDRCGGRWRHSRGKHGVDSFEVGRLTDHDFEPGVATTG
jgi:hypothetical protein